MAPERLQKILAHAGVSSRRAAEELITAGRVRVNGHIVSELGARADAKKDKIEVDGRILVAEDSVYIVLHKPRLVVSTVSDPEGRPTVSELVKGVDARLYPIGRLDFHTSGTLLLTNDGELTNALLHPKKHVPKTYIVKVQGEMEEGDAETWREGVKLEDGKTLPADVHIIRHENGKTWLEVTLREGRNQQIRRMGEATGFPVMRLARQSFAGITLEGLKAGQWRHLSVDELKSLREAYGAPRRIRSASTEVEGGTRRDHAKRGGFGKPAARAGSRDERPAPARAKGADERRPAGGGEGRERARGRDEERAPRGRDEARSPRGSERPAARGRAEPREARGRNERPGPSSQGRDERSSPSGRAGAPSGGPSGRAGGPGGRPRRSDQNSSAAVPSANTQASRGTRSQSPSRTRRPR